MSFRPNPLFEAQIAAQVRAKGLVPAARRIAAAASRHVRPTRPDRSRRPIEVAEADGDVAVTNTNFGGPIEEYGSKNSPAYMPLRRGVSESGYDLRES